LYNLDVDPEISPCLREIAGIKTHVLSGGQGEPVVFLHGLGASSYCWRHLLPVFARTNAVYAPDFPGYGRSGKPWEFDFTFQGYARWLGNFLDALGLERAALVGSSMGGAISLCLALDHPERVSRLVLIGAPVYLDNIPKMLWAMRQPIVGRILEPLLGRWTVRVVAPTAFHDRKFVTEDLIDEYSIALSTPEGRRAAAETLRRCLSPELPDMIRRYPELKPPVLFIRGDHDGVVDDVSAEMFCRAVADGRRLRIPRCGHVPQEEKPETVRSAIAEFLAKPRQPGEP
jgi:pimeloyl-ACP methyl ester carboxylesterase